MTRSLPPRIPSMMLSSRDPVPEDELLVGCKQERLTRPLGLLMRADSLDELKRLLGDLGVEIEPAFDVVEVTPDRQLSGPR